MNWMGMHQIVSEGKRGNALEIKFEIVGEAWALSHLPRISSFNHAALVFILFVTPLALGREA